jgi:hypothetical protein
MALVIVMVSLVLRSDDYDNIAQGEQKLQQILHTEKK